MKRLFLILVLLVCVVIGSHESALAAPKMERKQDRFDKMTHAELFQWALTTPIENKPWRVVLRIERSQKDPIAWGWNVNSELETAIERHFPQTEAVTMWQMFIFSGATDQKEFGIVDGLVAATIFHIRITNGVCGTLNDNDKW